MKTATRFAAAVLILLVIVVLVRAKLQPTASAASPNTGQTIVTVETKDAHPAELHSQDVMLYEERTRVPVTQLTPLAGQPAEIYIAIDQAIGPNLGHYLHDLRKFINAQPGNIAVGIVYMQDGAANFVQRPTTDHAAAANALRLPTANGGISPFESISDLIKHLPPNQVRRNLVVLSPGIEPFGGHEFSNPLVDDAISSVQRSLVPVFAVYLPAGGHLGHSFWRTNWAQAYLSRLADESGGEGYNLNALTIVSLESYFNDITQRLQRQYLVSFMPKTQSKTGFAMIQARTEVPHVELVTPDRAWIQSSE